MHEHLDSYDYIIVAFSGGKDSTAALLYLLELGVDPRKLELWHHLIDGNEGSTLMDWPVTADYCRKLARHFNIPIYFSWRIGGFEGEMLKENRPSAAARFEYPDDSGIVECGLAGGKGPPGTRLKFPQLSHNLLVRWCSGKLKIDVCDAAIRNQARFLGKRILVITGERAEESSARAKYETFAPHRADARKGRKQRHVDHWRPVHSWPERQVWEIIERWKVNPHPAYKLGCSRLSCMTCIFAGCHQFAMIQRIAPRHMRRLIEYEKRFCFTMKRGVTLPEFIARGVPFPNWNDKQLTRLGLSPVYYGKVLLEPWVLPCGAYGENDGPN